MTLSAEDVKRVSILKDLLRQHVWQMNRQIEDVFAGRQVYDVTAKELIENPILAEEEKTHNEYAEPWSLVPSGCVNEVKCVDANGAFIAGFSSDEGSISKDDPNWQRIIQCVNACAGKEKF